MLKSVRYTGTISRVQAQAAFSKTFGTKMDALENIEDEEAA